MKVVKSCASLNKVFHFKKSSDLLQLTGRVLRVRGVVKTFHINYVIRNMPIYVGVAT